MVAEVAGVAPGAVAGARAPNDAVVWDGEMVATPLGIEDPRGKAVDTGPVG